ncbi:MAG: hypothetical protein WBC07_08510 [Methylotenera sp.]
MARRWRLRHFTGLTDTPASYIGKALQQVYVNAAENALAFANSGLFYSQAVPNAAYDQSDLMQSEIDYCIQNNKIYVTASGNYTIAKGLIIANKTGTTFNGYCNFQWRGAGGTFPDLDYVGTRLICTHKTTFGIAVQGARGVLLIDINVTGAAGIKDWIYYNITTPAVGYTTMMDYANWEATAVGCRNNRYSPYTGIVIDPFQNGYPAGDINNCYPGLEAYYNASVSGKESASMVFERISAVDFVVGFGAGMTATASLQSEFSHIDCSYNFNISAHVTGHDQQRNHTMVNCSVAAAYYMFDGLTYGKQLGSSPSGFGIDGGICKYVYHITTRTGETAAKMYGGNLESFFALGFFGDTSVVGDSGAAIHCTNINQGFNQSLALVGAPSVFLKYSGNVNFYDCIIGSTNGNTLHYVSANYEQYVAFNGGTIAHNRQVYNGSSLPRVRFRETNVRDNLVSSWGNTSILGGRLTESDITHYDGFYTADGQEVQNTATPTVVHKTLGTIKTHYIGSAVVTKTTGNNGTVEFSTTAAISKVNVGDLINCYSNLTVEGPRRSSTTQGSVCLGVVTNVNIGTKTATIQGVPLELVSGSTLNVGTLWHNRYHVAGIATMTVGSAVLTAVSNPSSWKNALGSGEGMHILGLGLSDGTIVLSVNVGASTITLSQVAYASFTGTRIYDADIYAFTGTVV